MDLTYGHYRYNDKNYILREDVLNDMMMRQDWNGEMTFHYHDEVFEGIDWSVEPPFDIDLLYKMRAQQIRDKYKYVILQLSGGLDSTQVLEIFLDNNIFIDEIQTFHFHSGSKVFMSDKDIIKNLSVLYEYQFSVIPLLKWVKEVSPNTKIVEVDLMPDLIRNNCKTDSEIIGLNQITKGLINPPTIVHSVPRTVNYISMTHNVKNIEKDNVCVIRGIEKPSLVAFKDLGINQNTYDLYFNFHDLTMGSAKFMVGEVMSKSFTLEPFFWSPEAPLIPVKQSHLVKNRLRTDITFKEKFNGLNGNIFKRRAVLMKRILRYGIPYQQKLERLIFPVIYPSLRNQSLYFGSKPQDKSPEFKLLKLLGINHFGEEMKDEYNNHKLKLFEPIINKTQMIDFLPTRRYHIGKI
jgi:hypothetical protein